MTATSTIFTSGEINQGEGKGLSWRSHPFFCDRQAGTVGEVEVRSR